MGLVGGDSAGGGVGGVGGAGAAAGALAAPPLRHDELVEVPAALAAEALEGRRAVPRVQPPPPNPPGPPGSPIPGSAAAGKRLRRGGTASAGCRRTRTAGQRPPLPGDGRQRGQDGTRRLLGKQGSAQNAMLESVKEL